MMSEKSDLKDEFISTLSHEIRTPLTSIKGFSQTLLTSWDKFSDEKKREFVEIILSQSQRLINLTENVLNVAKMEEVDIILTKVNLGEVVQNSISLLSINNKDFLFETNFQNAQLYSLCDYDKTQQIILNILDNAIKYSKNSKKIEINVLNKNDFNVIKIKNFGSHIDDSEIEHIFEKFYRVTSYKNSPAQGSGLGLYIASNLINKMEGKIEVNSKEDWTEFLIYLPVYEIERFTKNIGAKKAGK